MLQWEVGRRAQCSTLCCHSKQAVTLDVVVMCRPVDGSSTLCCQTNCHVGSPCG